MWTHRIIYFLILVLAAVFFVMYPHWFAWYFLIFSLIVFPFDIIISLPGMITRRVALSAPYTMEQGETGDFVISVGASGRFPSGYLKMRLSIRDNDRARKQRVKCTGAAGSKVVSAIDTTHCGVISYTLKRCWAASIIGLFSIPVPVRRSATVLILPSPVKPPGSVDVPLAVVLRPKPGGGFSEEHDLRPFREGDQMKYVHWKLSAKHDSLIYREALSPPPQSRLIHASRWKGAHARDVILGRLRWVSGYLLEKDLPHFVKIGDSLRVEEISRPDDLVNCIYHALDNSFRGARISVPASSRFSWVYEIDAR